LIVIDSLIAPCYGRVTFLALEESVNESQGNLDGFFAPERNSAEHNNRRGCNISHAGGSTGTKSRVFGGQTMSRSRVGDTHVGGIRCHVRRRRHSTRHRRWISYPLFARGGRTTRQAFPRL